MPKELSASMTNLIDRHLTACRAGGLSPNTIEAREELLRRLDRQLPYGIEEATTEELQEWLSQGGWATKTRETYWCHLVAFYRERTRGTSEYHLDYDPSAALPRPRVGRHLPRVASNDQLAHALRSLARPALRAVILAAGVGMRAAEVADAERCDITRDRVLIHGKGDKCRSVPVPPDVWEEIRGCTGRLVTGANGRPLTPAGVTERVSDALTGIGLPRLTLHWFRGAYATRLCRAGVDSSVVRRLLGHASVATTQRYVEVVDADLDTAVAKLPPLPIDRERHQPAVTRLVPPTTEAA
jgi:site-specific recombinase XerD